MKLKFYARTGHIVPFPATKRTFGQFRRYIGRETIPGTATVKSKLLTTEAGTEFDTDLIGDDQVQQLRSALIRDGGLWCANEETAKFFGVPFTPVKFNEKTLVWEPIPAPTPPAEPEQGNKKGKAS